MSDAEPYRTKEEVAKYKDEDPILLVQHTLLENNWATQEELEKIVDEVKADVEECEKFAEESNFPPQDTMYKYTYSQDDYPFIDLIENK